MSNYEIELRGSLDKIQKEKLENILINRGKLIKEYKRTQWCFFNKALKNKDLRIKNTNGNWEISLKVGDLAKTSRKEISLSFLESDKKQAFNLLKFLGYNNGIIAVRSAKIYEYRGVEWAIVRATDDINYFEAEKLVKNKKDSRLAEEEIRAICLELGLKIFNIKEYREFIKYLGQKVNKNFKL